MSTPSSAIESVLVENRVFPPSQAVINAARISGMDGYNALCAEAAADFEGFWARLARAGNSLYSYQSTTGTNWTLVTSNSITMATNIYFGLAVASGNTNTLNTSTFTNLTVVP